MSRRRQLDDEEVLRACWKQLAELDHETFFFRLLSLKRVSMDLGYSDKTVAPSGKGDLTKKLIASIPMLDFLARTGSHPADALDALLIEAEKGTARWPDDVARTAGEMFTGALERRSELMRLRMLVWSQHPDPIITKALAGPQFAAEMRRYARRFDQLLAAFGRRRAPGVSGLALLGELGALEDGFIIRAAVEPSPRWAQAFATAVVRLLDQATVPISATA